MNIAFKTGLRPRLEADERVLYSGQQPLGPVLFRALGCAVLIMAGLFAIYAIVAGGRDLAVPPRELLGILALVAIPAVFAELRRSYRGLQLILTDRRIVYRWGWPKHRNGEIPVSAVAAIEGDPRAPFTVRAKTGEELWVYGLQDLKHVRSLIETAAGLR